MRDIAVIVEDSLVDLYTRCPRCKRGEVCLRWNWTWDVENDTTATLLLVVPKVCNLGCKDFSNEEAKAFLKALDGFIERA
jgi:hypothetical protein